jgi:tryptophanyl-tRNA synthetase
MEEPKDPNSCNVFALYKLMASESEIASMKANYEGGNYGYGHAKQALFELLIEQFSKEREMYNYYMENLEEVEKALEIGAKKASIIANEVLERVRKKLGY